MAIQTEYSVVDELLGIIKRLRKEKMELQIECAELRHQSKDKTVSADTLTNTEDDMYMCSGSAPKHEMVILNLI